MHGRTVVENEKSIRETLLVVPIGPSRFQIKPGFIAQKARDAAEYLAFASE